MFFRLIKRTFWVFYDNLFKGVLLNFILFVFLFLNVVITFKTQNYWLLTGIIIIWHIFSPAFTYYWSRAVNNQDLDDGIFNIIIKGFRLFGLKGMALCLINTAFVVVAVIGINFYKTMFTGNNNPAMLVLGGLGLWILIMFMLIQIYLVPIMVLDEKRRVLISYKKALIMLLSAPFTAMAVAVLTSYLLIVFYIVLHFAGAHIPTLLALVTLFPIFLLPFVTFTTLMIMQVNSAILIYEKHKIMPPLTEVWEENRGFSTLFRPWENKK